MPTILQTLLSDRFLSKKTVICKSSFKLFYPVFASCANQAHVNPTGCIGHTGLNLFLGTKSGGGGYGLILFGGEKKKITTNIVISPFHFAQLNGLSFKVI